MKVVRNTKKEYLFIIKKTRVEAVSIIINSALDKQAALLPFKSIIYPVSCPPIISPTPKATIASIAFSFVPDGSVYPHV